MIVKVCGLKESQNIQDIVSLDIDWIGYNFYKPSSRYITIVPTINNEIHQKKVGIFVNEDMDIVKDYIDKYDLDLIQLHGNETPEYCINAQSLIPIIKVFRIYEDFDFDMLDDFRMAEFFLFDTETKNYGGSGIKFDWNILNHKPICRPFLLSGGIGPDDVDEILKIGHPQFKGIDINSKFEISPGIKDVELVRKFVGKIMLKNSDKGLSSPLGVGGKQGKEKDSTRNPLSLKRRPALKDSDKALSSPFGVGGRNDNEDATHYLHSLKGRPTFKDLKEALISPLGVGDEQSNEETSRNPQSLKGRPTLPDSGEAMLYPSGAGGSKGSRDENSALNPQSLKGRPTLKDAGEAMISPLGAGGEKGNGETSRDPQSLKGRPTLKDAGEAMISPLGAGGEKGNGETSRDPQSLKGRPMLKDVGHEKSNEDEDATNYPQSLKGRPTLKDSGEAGLSPLGAGGSKGNKDENSTHYPQSLKGRPTLKDAGEAMISPLGAGGEKGNGETSRDPQSLKGRPTLKDAGEAMISPLGAGGEKGNGETSRDPQSLKGRPMLKDVGHEKSNEDEDATNYPQSLKGRPTLKDSGEAGLSPLGAGGSKGNKDENSALNHQSLKGRPTLKDSGGSKGKRNEDKSNEDEFSYDMFYGANPNIFEKAASLRRKMTSEELKVWEFLRSKPLNLKFRRQHPIDLFIADFYCHSIKLVVEIDGINHQYSTEADINRDNIFKSFGITILRYTNNEVNSNFQDVINRILEEANNLKKSPIHKTIT